MNHTKQVLVGLGGLALLAVSAGGVYAALYFRAQRTTVDLENTIAARQAALTAPSIRTDRFACDTIAPDSITQSYSIDIRTDDATIAKKQDQVTAMLQALGATIMSSSRNKQTNYEAGYSTVASVQAVLPVAKTAAFISQLKTIITSPEYTENEYNSTTNAVLIKQSCDINVSYLKNLASSEALYLQQLSSAQKDPSGETSDVITQKLTETRQNAAGYESSIENLLNQIYKAQISVNILQIPG